MNNPGLLLQIEGIDGDCRHPSYPGWMNVLWFSFGGAGEFGQNRPGHSVSIQMFVGRVSTFLQIACLRGDRFPSASLVALNPSRTGKRFHGLMDDVRISGFQYQGLSLDRAIHALEITYHGMELQEAPEVLVALPPEPEPIVSRPRAR